MTILNPASTQALSDLASFGAITPIDTTGYASNDSVALAEAYRVKVGEMLAIFRNEAQHIRDSRKLTKEGKQADLADLCRVTLPRFDTFEPFLKSTRERLAKLRASIVISNPAAGDNAAQAIREAEVRAMLPKDAIEVHQIFMAAIETGEQLVFDALRNAPSFLKILPPETIADGEAMWQRKRDPATAKLMQDLRNAIDVLEATLRNARKAIKNECGVDSATDPITAIAKGDGDE